MEPEGKFPHVVRRVFFIVLFKFGLISTIFSDTLRSLCLSWGLRMSRVLGKGNICLDTRFCYRVCYSCRPHSDLTAQTPEKGIVISIPATRFYWNSVLATLNQLSCTAIFCLDDLNREHFNDTLKPFLFFFPSTLMPTFHSALSLTRVLKATPY